MNERFALRVFKALGKILCFNFHACIKVTKVHRSFHTLNDHFGCKALLHLARGIDIGLEQLRIATGDLRQQLLDRLVLEVQRSLDYFDRQFSYLTLSKLMLAPLPEDAELQTYFSENLYVTVEELQLQDALDISGVPELASSAAQGDRFMAIGAALRQESAA